MFDWFKKKKPTPPAPAASAEPPLNAWVRIPLPHFGEVIAFAYVDPQAGISAKGGPEGSAYNAVTVRYPVSAPWIALDEAERRRLALPDVPDWLHFYGPQPAADRPWRTDPLLRARFHESHPDDLEAIVHDGEPRRTGIPPEKCWVKIVGAEPGPTRALIFSPEATALSNAEFTRLHQNNGLVYLARLLNTPFKLKTVKEGDTLRILAGAWKLPPLHVTPAYLAERAAWHIQPCDKCSLSECMDPPSTMAKFKFPNVGGEMEGFTSFCPLCGGGLQLLSRNKP